MKRFAVPLVIAGSLAVLVALFVLLRAITTDSPAAPVTTAPPRPVEVAGPTPAADPWATQPPAPTTPSVVPKPSRPSSAPTPSLVSSSETPSTETSSDAPPGTRLNTKNLHFGLPQLREKIAQNAPHVQACLNGSKVTGEATVTFIVAQKAGKIVVEQTDADHEASTIKDEALLECLQKSSEKIQLDGLPREAEAIIVTRVMTLQDGTLADDKPLKFSYIR